MLFTVPYTFAQTTFPNPLGQTKTVTGLIDAVSTAVIMIALPIAVIAIIIVGLRLLIAGASGETGKVTESKTLLWWVVIGTAIVVGSAAIAKAVVSFVETLGGT